MKLVHWIFSICLFTASWDLIFVVHVGGTLRLSQLLMIPVCLAACARILQDRRILWPRGGTILCIWIFGQLLMLPLSLNFTLAVEFFCLLVFSAATIFVVVQIYGQSDLIENLMRVYMISYFVTALFGLVQFAMPLIGLPGILVSQWIVHGRLARINGFTYEPSYFSTYIVIGWIMMVDLRLSKARIAEGRFWKWATIILGVTLILCTSKTGWLIMILELIARLLPVLWRVFRGGLRQARMGQMLVSLPHGGQVLTAVFIFFVIAGGAITVTSLINPMVFLSGSGLAGAPAHSYNARAGNAQKTYEAFLDHPWIGPSLGGVPVYLAAKQGVTITDAEGVRLYWGSPVILEVLVGSGVFFFIPFLMFLYTTTFGAMRFAKRHWPDERAKWLRALARAMIFEWLMLLSEQNLLRTYLWYHFAMVVLVAYHLEFARAPAHIDSRSQAHAPGLQEAGATS